MSQSQYSASLLGGSESGTISTSKNMLLAAFASIGMLAAVGVVNYQVGSQAQQSLFATTNAQVFQAGVAVGHTFVPPRTLGSSVQNVPLQYESPVAAQHALPGSMTMVPSFKADATLSSIQMHTGALVLVFMGVLAGAAAMVRAVYPSRRQAAYVPLQHVGVDNTWAMAAAAAKAEEDQVILDAQKKLLDLRIKQATKQEFKPSEFGRLKRLIARRRGGDMSAVDSEVEVEAATIAMLSVTARKEEDQVILDAQKELLNLRIKQATKQEFKPSEFGRLKRLIAKRRGGDMSAVDTSPVASDSETEAAIAMFAMSASKEEDQVILDAQKELLSLRIKQATKQEFKPSEFGRLKKLIAQRRGGYESAADSDSAVSDSETEVAIAMFAMSASKGDDEVIKAAQKELLDLRIKQATKQEFKPSEFGRLKKLIARRRGGDMSAVDTSPVASDSEAEATIAMFAMSGDLHEDQKKAREGMEKYTGSGMNYQPPTRPPATNFEGKRAQNRRYRLPEEPNDEYDQEIYELKKKLLMLRIAKATNSPDFKPHEMKKAKKMVARLLTAKRFEQLRANGVDPYAKARYTKRQRVKMQKDADARAQITARHERRRELKRRAAEKEVAVREEAELMA